MSEDADPPVRVVKGDPTPEELAALVAVISAKAAEAGGAETERPSTWAAYWRTVRTAPLRPGPGAWRASGLPR
ncbi:MAG: acyl-CoA carboxylase subunit epsilon [Actinomycetota bacterium]